MEKLGIYHGVSQRFVIFYKDGTHFSRISRVKWAKSKNRAWDNKIAGRELVEWLD